MIKWSNIHIIRISEGEGKEQGTATWKEQITNMGTEMGDIPTDTTEP